MDEIWKNIPVLEGKYQISTLGKVKSREGYILKQQILEYPCVTITHKKKKYLFRIHRLLAEAFIPNPENKKTVNHINGIKTDCRLINLEWSTYSEQERHKRDVLGFKTIMPKGINSPHNRKIIKISANGDETIYYSITQATEETKINKTIIHRFLNGTTKKSRSGIKWKYA